MIFEMKENRLRVLISGGGTGGHIFPALSIANELRRRCDAEILFVGAEDRMEMEKVPAAGYPIKGLPVAGFDRKHLLRNVSVLIKLWRSISRARRIVKDFRPDIAIGVGGYASGPTLKAAQRAGIPTLIQEQNSYAGVTNKLLAKKADRICVAYEGMERFFPGYKIVMTGNPVRAALLEERSKEEARSGFGLDPGRPTLLVVGGSLGARTLNEAMEASLDKFTAAGVQVIWQTGKNFGDRAEKAAAGKKGIAVMKFITDMAAAYAAADIVVSRAGAGSISELELLGKPCILVPSPNVAEDHQTKNALALADAGAAILISDADARGKLTDTALAAIASPERLRDMGDRISRLAIQGSDRLIVDEVLKLTKSLFNNKCENPGGVSLR